MLTLFLPLGQITPEMQARVNPNLLDLMVAIFSGIAGAYAFSKEEIAKSLAGVAIAVALVQQAKKGLFYTFVMMVVIAIPLVISFSQMVEHNKYLSKLESLRSITLDKEQVELVILNIQNKEQSIIVNLEVVSTKPLSALEYQIIKRKYEEIIDKKVILRIVPEVVVK